MVDEKQRIIKQKFLIIMSLMERQKTLDGRIINKDIDITETTAECTESVLEFIEGA